MKLTIWTFVLILFSNLTFGQDILDIDGLKECELFPKKGKFDNSERLQKVKELRGELITVYLLKRGKKNIIKNSYTGTIDFVLIDKEEKLGKEHSVEVLPIKLESVDGSYKGYIPITNVNYFRFYKTDCLNK